LKYQEYISKNNKTLNSLSKSLYDRVLLNRDEKFRHPIKIVFLKDSLPIRIIYGINGRNEKEVYEELNQYAFSKEISKEEFEYYSFLAAKISTLGINAIYEQEFIKQLPKSVAIENENKQLIQDNKINSPIAINQIVQDSGFTVIENKKQFNDLLNEKKAVLYIQINWSGAERIGRIKIIKALSGKHFNKLPKYLINHSNQEFQFFNDYISKYNDGIGRLVNYGSGEILLLKNGKIKDYMERGFLINREILIELFKKWITIAQVKTK